MRQYVFGHDYPLALLMWRALCAAASMSAMIEGDGDPRHGTHNGYGNLKCRCAACRAANTKHHAEYMARTGRRSKPTPYKKSKMKPVVPKTGMALKNRAAAHVSWANTEDPSARTAPARDAFMARFERQVDPDGKLSAAERTRRAEHARKAYFALLAIRSAEKRAASR
jgi:hypothetical protein